MQLALSGSQFASNVFRAGDKLFVFPPELKNRKLEIVSLNFYRLLSYIFTPTFISKINILTMGFSSPAATSFFTLPRNELLCQFFGEHR